MECDRKTKFKFTNQRSTEHPSLFCHKATKSEMEEEESVQSDTLSGVDADEEASKKWNQSLLVDLTSGKSEEEEEDRVRVAREARVDFLDGHDENPFCLAKSIYPNGIELSDDQYQTIYKLSRKGRAPPQPKVDSDKKEKKREKEDKVPWDKQVTSGIPMICYALAYAFVLEMKECSLDVDWIRSKQTVNWVHSLRDQVKDRVVQNQRFRINSRVKFFCSKCMAYQKQERGGESVGLVAVGMFKAKDEEKYKKRNKSEWPQVSDYFLEIESMYYHSCECEKPMTSLRNSYNTAKYAMFDIPLEWVLGNRYQMVVKKIDEYPRAGFFFTEKMVDLEKEELKKLYRDSTAGSDTTVYGLREKGFHWTSLGDPINWGAESYKCDDRSRMLLPGPPFGGELKEEDHRMSMARLLFVVVNRMGLESEVSPFLLDERNFVKILNKSKRESGNDEVKMKNPYLELSKMNEKRSVHLKEVSVLFGGNEREIFGVEPVHQYCHVHCPKASRREPETFHDSEPFDPGTLLLPLQDGGRTIYFHSPAEQNRIHVPSGSVLLFKGDLPHGGITRRNDGGKQYAAIQAHLDKIQGPKRMPVLFAGGYYHKEHLRLQPIVKFCDSYLQKRKDFYNFWDVVAERDIEVVMLKGELSQEVKDSLMEASQCDEETLNRVVQGMKGVKAQNDACRQWMQVGKMVQTCEETANTEKNVGEALEGEFDESQGTTVTGEDEEKKTERKRGRQSKQTGSSRQRRKTTKKPTRAGHREEAKSKSEEAKSKSNAEKKTETSKQNKAGITTRMKLPMTRSRKRAEEEEGNKIS